MRIRQSPGDEISVFARRDVELGTVAKIPKKLKQQSLEPKNLGLA